MNPLFTTHSIREILGLYTEQALSPQEVAQAVLQNIAVTDPKYFAWVVAADESWPMRIQKEYEQYGLDPRHLLDYIPVGVKDIYNTRDFPTQMGSPLWKDFTPGNDARAVYHLRRQGAVIAGKTVTAEFAVHALEKTLNPYDIQKTPGTSSSGSAVAVSLGVIPFATGSQTAGSIIRPASFCGVYGMKPSFGLIPRTGTLKTTDSLDTLGFFAIHAEDLRRGFESMRVSGENYPISHRALTDSTRQEKPHDRPWRVALVQTHTWEHAPEYAREKLRAFGERLSRSGVEVVEASIPAAMEHAHQVHETIYNKSLAYYFEQEHKKPEFVSPVMHELITSGASISGAQLVAAIADQTDLIHRMDAFFEQYDVLISLSTAGEAPPREITERPDPSLMWTLTHLPVVNLPIGMSPNNLPFGLQVASRKYNDYRLLAFIDFLLESGLIPKRAGYAVPRAGEA